MKDFLSRDLLDQFNEDGVVCVRQLIDKAWIEKLRSATDEILAAPNQYCADISIQSDTGRFFNGFFQYLGHKEFRSFLFHSDLPKAARFFAQSSGVRFFYDQLMVKESGTSQRTPWHKDIDYFPLSGRQILSAWTPMDSVTSANGALYFLRGSHRQPVENYLAKIPVQVSDDVGRLKFTYPDFDKFPETFDLISFDTEPGDCLFFHIDILHFALANLTTTRRRALASRWLGDDVQVQLKPGHLFEDPKIQDFLRRHHHVWNGSLDNPLFPLLAKL